MGTLGCVECPPGKSVNVIVPLIEGMKSQILGCRSQPSPSSPRKGHMGGQVDHVQGYSIIDYVDNRAKENFPQ